MTIASRIRKIREISGWKQCTIAASLNISQQAYSSLEKGADSAKFETIRNFCEVMDVKISFLLATDIEITKETLREFRTKGFAEIIGSYRKLAQKVEVFEELYGNEFGKEDTPGTNPTHRTA